MPISKGTHRQPLQLLVDSHPHVVQNLEGGDVAEPTFQVATDRHQGGRAHHRQAEPNQRARRRWAGEHGQNLPDDEGGQDAERGVKDRAKDGDREQAAMPARDRQHAGQEDHEFAILNPPPPLAGPVGPRERRFSARRAFETFGDGRVGAPVTNGSPTLH
jgi:hypothetical protein